MELAHLLIIAFVILFVALFVLKDMSSRFLVLMTCVVVGYILYQQQKTEMDKNRNMKVILDKKENELSDDFEVPENNIFHVHKTPRNLKFIKRHSEFMHVIHDLRFLNIYDRALYNKLISYIEYFLKIHYKIMIGKYEVELYLGMLKDIRSEILNIMKSIYFNIPNVSTILYIDNLDDYVEKRIKTVQALTYKLMKVIGRKYQKNVKPPFDHDLTKDIHYALF